MKKYNRVCATIDMDAVAYNVEQMLKNIKSGTSMLVVIKADGYGHGAVPIAAMLEKESYIWGFAVATLDEGVVLRKHGITKPILVLGCIFPDQYQEMLEHDIRMTVYTKEMAETVSQLAVKEGKKAYFHIKLDTGMGRLGFSIKEESVQTIKQINEMP
ncbi:MAG: alanine racemase, partial [Lachnospiraceae bacterium]